MLVFGAVIHSELLPLSNRFGWFFEQQVASLQAISLSRDLDLDFPFVEDWPPKNL